MFLILNYVAKCYAQKTKKIILLSWLCGKVQRTGGLTMYFYLILFFNFFFSVFGFILLMTMDFVLIESSLLFKYTSASFASKQFLWIIIQQPKCMCSYSSRILVYENPLVIPSVECMIIYLFINDLTSTFDWTWCLYARVC